ncbi:lipid II:glycine glycyltransferase FemX [Propionispora vibrioides]|uniref:Acetyltransferase (GNAT) domain-containing protein n=1 Tax=Propionispora vibrioides TaxID=112903 RepID=A0A1H8S0C0_9FIRM|nr:GNAT family N-acetyltransferase [Propionispora vibrioides]SEO72389.1 Acetyltransferase (GNAT) domain-containing protein [Propionispora vibrioides]
MNCCLKSSMDVDSSIWNHDVLQKTGNPAQLYEAAFAVSTKVTPVFIEIIKDNVVVFRWLVFYRGYKCFGYIQANAEPTNCNLEYIDLAVKEIIKKFRPFKFEFYSITLSRFTNRKILYDLGFCPIYEYGSSIIDLTKSEEELFEGVHSKHRNVIRKAVKEGVQIVEDTSVEAISTYFDLSQETYARSNIPGVAKQELIHHYQALAATGNCRIFFAVHQGCFQAAAFMLVSKNNAVYWHGASKNKPIPGSANLLHWEIIKKFKRENILYYDFGGIILDAPTGSKERGVSLFKTRFGGTINSFFGGQLILNSMKNSLLNWWRRIQ